LNFSHNILISPLNQNDWTQSTYERDGNWMNIAFGISKLDHLEEKIMDERKTLK
jgi:hypothetical protein